MAQNSSVPHEDAVLSEKPAAEHVGLSRQTFRRRRKAGDGPKTLRLSPGRIGFRVRDLNRWLESRAENGSAARTSDDSAL